VTNTGSRRGAEVVQAYVEPPPSPLFRPRRELRSFAKVWVEPGETVVARLELPPRAFAYWDPGSTESAMLAERLGDAVVVPADKGPEPASQSGWRTQGGLHRVHLNRSIDDIVTTVEIVVPGHE
jgi:hypothetical protein